MSAATTKTAPQRKQPSVTDVTEEVRAWLMSRGWCEPERGDDTAARDVLVTFEPAPGAFTAAGGGMRFASESSWRCLLSNLACRAATDEWRLLVVRAASMDPYGRPSLPPLPDTPPPPSAEDEDEDEDEGIDEECIAFDPLAAMLDDATDEFGKVFEDPEGREMAAVRKLLQAMELMRTQLSPTSAAESPSAPLKKDLAEQALSPDSVLVHEATPPPIFIGLDEEEESGAETTRMLTRQGQGLAAAREARALEALFSVDEGDGGPMPSTKPPRPSGPALWQKTVRGVQQERRAADALTPEMGPVFETSPELRMETTEDLLSRKISKPSLKTAEPLGKFDLDIEIVVKRMLMLKLERTESIEDAVHRAKEQERLRGHIASLRLLDDRRALNAWHDRVAMDVCASF